MVAVTCQFSERSTNVERDCFKKNIFYDIFITIIIILSRRSSGNASEPVTGRPRLLDQRWSRLSPPLRPTILPEKVEWETLHPARTDSHQLVAGFSPLSGEF